MTRDIREANKNNGDIIIFILRNMEIFSDIIQLFHISFIRYTMQKIKIIFILHIASLYFKIDTFDELVWIRYNFIK